MSSILQDAAIDKLPVAELQAGLELFLQPVLRRLPEQRLRAVAKLAVQGILGSQSPVLTHMARGVVRKEETIWPAAKRFYRFVWNERFSHRDLLKGLYGMAQRTVAEHRPSVLVVALDPVNFEKPYTEELEGVSTVMKSTPPPPKGQRKRLTPGYPAITAAVVNLPEPVLTYANWFSYVTADFVSENREIYRAIRASRALFPETKLHFVGDAGLDDQKIFHQMDLVHAEFTIRASHNRAIEVYNDRLDRWEEELLHDLTASVPLPLKFRVSFTHARKVRHVDIELGWLMIRLPETHQVLWALVAHDPDYDRDLVLLTSIPVRTAADAQIVYTEWRYRPGSNTPIALTKRMGWTSKTCGCRPSSGCVASSRWFSWLPCSSIMSLTSGPTAWSSGFAAWAANWASLPTWTAPMSCWPASVPSSSPRLRWFSPLNTPSPEQEGLVGNHQNSAINKIKVML